MLDSSVIVPALTALVVLCGLHARLDVYAAFVRGAKEGLRTLADMLPYLCAVFAAAGLLRETGVMSVAEAALSPVLSGIGIPAEAASVVLLRPLSGSAALSEVQAVMQACGADSRAARYACVVCGAGETMLLTGSLYMGAGGVRKAGGVWASALGAYAAGLAAASLLV